MLVPFRIPGEKKLRYIVRLVLFILICTLATGCLPKGSIPQVYIIEPGNFGDYLIWKAQGASYLLVFEGISPSTSDVFEE